MKFNVGDLICYKTDKLKEKSLFLVFRAESFSIDESRELWVRYEIEQISGPRVFFGKSKLEPEHWSGEKIEEHFIKIS